MSGADHMGKFASEIQHRAFGKTSKERKMSSNFDQFVAGGIGGMAGVLAGHPLGEHLYCWI